MGLSLLTDSEICFVYTVLKSAFELRYDKNEERLERLKSLKGLSKITDDWFRGVDVSNVYMATTTRLLDINYEMSDRFFKKCLEI